MRMRFCTKGSCTFRTSFDLTFLTLPCLPYHRVRVADAINMHWWALCSFAYCTSDLKFPIFFFFLPIFLLHLIIFLCAWNWTLLQCINLCMHIIWRRRKESVRNPIALEPNIDRHLHMTTFYLRVPNFESTKSNAIESGMGCVGKYFSKQLILKIERHKIAKRRCSLPFASLWFSLYFNKI